MDTAVNTVIDTGSFIAGAVTGSLGTFAVLVTLAWIGKQIRHYDERPSRYR